MARQSSVQPRARESTARHRTNAGGGVVERLVFLFAGTVYPTLLRSGTFRAAVSTGTAVWLHSGAQWREFPPRDLRTPTVGKALGKRCLGDMWASEDSNEDTG